jgi:hypothetical protein
MELRMLRKLLVRFALVAAVATATVHTSHAACALSDLTSSAVSGQKIWQLIGTEVTSGNLFFCKFKINSNGSVSLFSKACAETQIGDASFGTPSKYDIKSGLVTLGQDCAFDIRLDLVSGTTVMRAQAVLAKDKNTLAGNFLVSWGGGGAFSMVRIQ